MRTLLSALVASSLLLVSGGCGAGRGAPDPDEPIRRIELNMDADLVRDILGMPTRVSRPTQELTEITCRHPEVWTYEFPNAQQVRRVTFCKGRVISYEVVE